MVLKQLYRNYFGLLLDSIGVWWVLLAKSALQFERKLGPLLVYLLSRFIHSHLVCISLGTWNIYVPVHEKFQSEIWIVNGRKIQREPFENHEKYLCGQIDERSSIFSAAATTTRNPFLRLDDRFSGRASK